MTVSLREHHGLAILSGETTTASAVGLARSIAAQIAHYHSPRDVRLVVLAPNVLPPRWGWVPAWPEFYGNVPAVATAPKDRTRLLRLLLQELMRREQALLERRASERSAPLLLPHLVSIAPLGAEGWRRWLTALLPPAHG